MQVAQYGVGAATTTGQVTDIPVLHVGETCYLQVAAVSLCVLRLEEEDWEGGQVELWMHNYVMLDVRKSFQFEHPVPGDMIYNQYGLNGGQNQFGLIELLKVIDTGLILLVVSEVRVEYNLPEAVISL